MSDADTPPMARPRVAAGALFFDAEGRVLLVKPTYKDGWDIPGGYVEPGETPLEACTREVEEELALRLRIGRLLLVDWAPSAAEGDKVLFVFDGGLLSPQEQSLISLPAEELESWSFQAPDMLEERLNDRLSRRIRSAVASSRKHESVYAEHGQPPEHP